MKGHLIVVFMLYLPAAAHGAYFSYYAGGLQAFCDVYAEDIDNYDGPYSDVNDDTSFAAVDEYAEVTGAYGYAGGSIWDSNDPANNSICLRANSFADAIADNTDSNGTAYGYGRTEDALTYGIYYQIVPGDREAIGDAVVVHFIATIKVAAWGQTYAYVGGPADLTHIAITKGLLPPVLTDPNGEYEVLGIDNLELIDESFDWCSGVYSFNAKIGDVIGIFAESYTEVWGLGPLDGVVESDLTIALTVKATLPGDLDDNGTVDYYDFSILADNWLKNRS